ncbi:MAG: hypothetical protein HKN47_24985 [Pirellulaceae bacterium]|nr:hypothetical protein [Pirellulaceae bacterium]
MNPSLVFTLNLLATWYLVGLIWMVQIVHYNLFDRVGDDAFERYEADHGRLITPIVGPPMLIEIATAALLITTAPIGFPRWAAIAGLTMVVLIWLSTALLQVPCHNRLMAGFDLTTYRQLVWSNWIRTVLWTTRGGLMGYFLLQILPRN